MLFLLRVAMYEALIFHQENTSLTMCLFPDLKTILGKIPMEIQDRSKFLQTIKYALKFFFNAILVCPQSFLHWKAH